MLKYLAGSMLYRRLGRAIPNPILRTVAIAGAGMAARHLMARRAARRATLPSRPALGGRPTGHVVSAS